MDLYCPNSCKVQPGTKEVSIEPKGVAPATVHDSYREYVVRMVLFIQVGSLSMWSICAIKPLPEDAPE